METSCLCTGLDFGKAFPISLDSLSLVLVLQGRLYIRFWGNKWSELDPNHVWNFQGLDSVFRQAQTPQSPSLPRKLGPPLVPIP